jgi:hypothetical protein
LDDIFYAMTKQTSRLAMLALSMLILFPDQAKAQFRNMAFGATMEEIVKKEKGEFLRTTPLAVLYQDELFGFSSVVAYHFCPMEDILCKGTYTLDTTGYEIEEILDHYMKVKRVMDHRYGESMKSGVVWWGGESTNQNDLVNAFRFGEVSFVNEWYGPGVHINLRLSNELNTQGEIVYRINYEPGRHFDFNVDVSKL